MRFFKLFFSSLLVDLTEEERIICGQSAQFEDFVIQFLDRCFTLINSSSLEETRVEMSSSDHRTTRDESLKDVGLASTISAILTQVNPSVLNSRQSYNVRYF